VTSVLSAVCRYEQRHHGLLGYAVPAPHLKPLPSGTGTSQTAADAPALSVLGDRRSETLQDGSIRRLSVNTSTCVCVCVCAQRSRGTTRCRCGTWRPAIGSSRCGRALHPPSLRCRFDAERTHCCICFGRAVHG